LYKSKNEEKNGKKSPLRQCFQHFGHAENIFYPRIDIAGMGIAYIGLGLIPELARVEDVLVGQLKAPQGTYLPTDKEIYTTCLTCNTQQTLSQAQIVREGQKTVYICQHGCQDIVIVGEPGDVPWEGRGYRLGEHVIRNAQDL